MSMGNIAAKLLSSIFQEVATPVKAVGRGSQKKFVRDVNTKGEERGSIVIPTEETVEPLVARQGRALASESSVSVMPAPGKFFNPKNSSYKGDRMSGMLEEANIELDLDFDVEFEYLLQVYRSKIKDFKDYLKIDKKNKK
mgnify:CR=1 FL=1